jgi:hypothetical protein
MGALAQLGIGCLILSCTAVGLRLVALGARSRRLPELAMGAGYLLFGALGYPLAAVARASAAEGAAHAGLWLAAALAIQNLGVIGGYVFNWRVFRPGRAGAAVAALGAGLLAASWVGHGVDPGWAGAESRGPWYFLGLATRAAAFVWGAAEAFVYWRRLRRRLALGLADAVVTNRMLLWATSELVIALGFGVFAAATLARTGVNAAPVVLAIAACGLGAATSMTLAIFPPARYLRWAEASAASGPRSEP